MHNLAFVAIGSISTLGIQMVWRRFVKSLNDDVESYCGPNWRG
jgi:hypothetical protein